MLKVPAHSTPALASVWDGAALSMDLRGSDFAPFIDGELPTFESLRRCTWGTHVTVHGQPAKFHQAGVIDGRNIVIVLAMFNPVLAAACRRSEAACSGEVVYYFDYACAGIHVGTPAHAPLLRDQAPWLRSGDIVQLNDCLCTFLESKGKADQLWLTLHSAPSSDNAIAKLGAVHAECARWGKVWRQIWGPDLRLLLVSARLPTFEELRSLQPRKPVTIGANAVQANLRGTMVQGGTRQYVLVEAPPWLSLNQTESQQLPDSGNWLYRIRFQESALRLAEHSCA